MFSLLYVSLGYYGGYPRFQSRFAFEPEYTEEELAKFENEHDTEAEFSEIEQGGHKPGKHGKPGKLREFEKLSKSQGKLREI